MEAISVKLRTRYCWSYKPQCPVRVSVWVKLSNVKKICYLVWRFTFKRDTYCANGNKRLADFISKYSLTQYFFELCVLNWSQPVISADGLHAPRSISIISNITKKFHPFLDELYSNCFIDSSLKFKAGRLKAEFRTQRISGTWVFSRISNPIPTMVKTNCLVRILKTVVDLIHSKIWSPYFLRKNWIFTIYRRRSFVTSLWYEFRSVFPRGCRQLNLATPKRYPPLSNYAFYVSTGLASSILTNISTRCTTASIYIQRYAWVFVFGHSLSLNR